MLIHTEKNNIENHGKYIAFCDLVRSFLQEKGYTEIQVPTLSPVIIPESHLDIYKTQHRFAGEATDLYLTPHPELFLKRLLCPNLPQVFSISRSYRNSETATHRHLLEFDMLEFYSLNHNYQTLQTEVMQLLQYCSRHLFGKEEISYNNKIISLHDCEIVTFSDAFAEYAGITDVFHEQTFLEQAQSLGYTTDGFDVTDVVSQILSDKVENHLGTQGKPTLLIDYPPALGATSKVNKQGIVEKWELYIEGIELGNAANEDSLFNQQELLQYYQIQNSQREQQHLDPITPDRDFASIVASMPSCAGIGMGLERLAMIFYNLQDIRELRPCWVE